MAAVMHGDGQPPEIPPVSPALEGLTYAPDLPVSNAAIPRQAIIGWLAVIDGEIASTVAELRSNRPNIFAHPLQRLRYVGAVAVQAGKRQAVNYIAEKIAGHDDTQSDLAK